MAFSGSVTLTHIDPFCASCSGTTLQTLAGTPFVLWAASLLPSHSFLAPFMTVVLEPVHTAPSPQCRAHHPQSMQSLAKVLRSQTAHAPRVLPHRSPGPLCSRWTWNCVNQEDCSTDKTCSFVSSSPNHHLSQAAGLAAASGRVWAFRAKQCPAKKPFYPSWASELYMSCPSPLPSHLTVM